MKHLGSFIYLVVLVFLVAVTSEVQATDDWGPGSYLENRVTLHIRTTPNFKQKKNIIHALKPGTILLVMDQTASGHLRVRTSEGTEGYIFNNQRYLKKFTPPVQESRDLKTASAVQESRDLKAESPVQESNDLKTASAVQESNDLKIASVSTSGQIAISNSQVLLMPLCGCTHERCRLTSRFGMRKHPVLRYKKMHLGVDIGGPIGQPVRAAEDGVVGPDTKLSRYGWGNRVVLIHKETLKDNKGNVVSTKGYETQYNHLHKVLVKAGQRVKRGDIIGTLGSTGRSTGPHLDFNVRANGKYLDPMQLLEKDSVKYSKEMKNTIASCPVESTTPGASGNTTVQSVQ